MLMCCATELPHARLRERTSAAALDKLQSKSSTWLALPCSTMLRGIAISRFRDFAALFRRPRLRRPRLEDRWENACRNSPLDFITLDCTSCNSGGCLGRLRFPRTRSECGLSGVSTMLAQTRLARSSLFVLEVESTICLHLCQNPLYTILVSVDRLILCKRAFIRQSEWQNLPSTPPIWCSESL